MSHKHTSLTKVTANGWWFHPCSSLIDRSLWSLQTSKGEQSLELNIQNILKASPSMQTVVKSEKGIGILHRDLACFMQQLPAICPMLGKRKDCHCSASQEEGGGRGPTNTWLKFQAQRAPSLNNKIEHWPFVGIFHILYAIENVKDSSKQLQNNFKSSKQL